MFYVFGPSIAFPRPNPCFVLSLSGSSDGGGVYIRNRLLSSLPCDLLANLPFAIRTFIGDVLWCSLRVPKPTSDISLNQRQPPNRKQSLSSLGLLSFPYPRFHHNPIIGKPSAGQG